MSNTLIYFYLKWRLVGQSLSALIAATLQNLSACRRCHSLTETMYLALLSFFGLISSFHNTFSCIWFFLFFVFNGFRRFFRLKPVYTHDNFPIISQKRKARQAILCVFYFSFTRFTEFLCLFIQLTHLYAQVKLNIDCRLLRRFPR